MDPTLTLGEALTVLATAVSPLIAVQVTRFLDDRNEQRGRKLAIFKTLMSTRASLLSHAHVEALNRIDLEFSAKRPTEKKVLDAWQHYLDHLSNAQTPNEAWGTRRVDLLLELLDAMAQCVGYSFNKTQLKNAVYSPSAHGQLETEQGRIRAMVLEVLEGTRDLPMRVTSLPDVAAPQATTPPTNESTRSKL